MNKAQKILSVFLLSFFAVFFLLNLESFRQPLKPASTGQSENIIVTASPTQRVGVTPKPFFSPTPLPLLTALSNTPVKINSVNTTVIVPAGSKYKTDYSWNITIYPTSNLNIMMCWGCQPIGTFAVCGESYGMSGKGLCESKPILIGDWEMEQHYFKKTNLFAFIAGPSGTSLGRSGSDFISVTTNNHQYPTSSEIKFMEKILSGISGE